jgi:hypothetical protein
VETAIGIADPVQGPKPWRGRIHHLLQPSSVLRGSAVAVGIIGKGAENGKPCSVRVAGSWRLAMARSGRKNHG